MKAHDQIVQNFHGITPGFQRRLNRGLGKLGLARFGYGFERPILPRALRKALQHLTGAQWIYLNSGEIMDRWRCITLLNLDSRALLTLTYDLRKEDPTCVRVLQGPCDSTIEIPATR